jgi:hypothetical protein
VLGKCQIPVGGGRKCGGWATKWSDRRHEWVCETHWIVDYMNDRFDELERRLDQDKKKKLE